MWVPFDGIGLVLLGLVVLSSVRLVFGARSSRRYDQVHLVLRASGWVMLAVGLLAAAQSMVGAALGALYWAGSLLMLGIANHRLRGTEQNSLLLTLAITAERQMPVAPTLTAFAADWSGQFGGRVARLATALSAGLPLPEALQRQRGLLPGSAVVAAHTGTEIGRLGAVLREAAESRALHEPLWQTLLSRLYYLYCLIFLAQLCLTWVVHTLGPQMSMILLDFDVEPVPGTIMVIDWLESPSVFWPTYVVLWVELALLVYFTLFFLNWVPWSPPLFNRLTRPLDVAGVLRSLAWYVSEDRPLTTGMRQLSESYHRRWMRRRLAAVCQEMEQGADWTDRLQARRLLSGDEAAVLRSAQRAGNLPWAMREMARVSERRLAERLRLTLHIVYPLVICLLGAMVAVMVAGFFLPLVTIMEKLVP